jgi:hypothetical protein
MVVCTTAWAADFETPAGISTFFYFLGSIGRKKQDFLRAGISKSVAHAVLTCTELMVQ